MGVSWEGLPPGLGALRSPLFRKLQLVGAVSNVGDWMQITARAVLVFSLTGSTSSLGALYLAQYLPQIVLLPVAGLIADRFDRRVFIVATTVVQALAAGVLAVLCQSGHVTLTWVLLLSVASGTAQTMGGPAGMALLPSVVSREFVPSAVTISISVSNGARIVGPLLGAAVISSAGVTAAFWANAASFLGVLLVWSLARVDGRAGLLQEPTTLHSLAEGWHLVRSRSSLRVPIAHLAVLSAIGIVYQPLGIAFATRVLEHGSHDRGQSAFGVLQAAIGVGAVLGVIASGRLLPRPVRGLSLTGLTFSVALGALAFSPSLGPAVAASLVLGAGQFAQSNLVLVLVQSEVPDHLRGRVMAVVMVAWVGLVPFSALGFGLLTQVITIPTAFALAALVCGIASVVVSRATLAPHPGEHAELIEVAEAAIP